ncbi:MAG TPA: chemotaxis protein CheW [Casimicrobium huifangae]|uniref:chemotaxis protein CheW n=1 Tax=Casimicrobium huifangae TaxID=2591109 RepID=UPI0012EBBF58|nr:chemotaxis protein CheW [Casimicrobium huifangae]HOB00730.1 chemotaxis protein CheW [Casimicrobium huifangae]HQA33726.1 chemotaxis protein CheW [Casimicrobium huifangae]HQD64110.1 chemotaxis protein CheW [Casimicrobium huifangae]
MARDRNRLRDFQEALAMRLRQAAELPQRQSRLAVQVGDRGFLLNLDDVSEVSPVGSVTPVPLTQPWFLGVTNVRGTLYAVTDFALWLGLHLTSDIAAKRLILLGQRLGKVRAGLIVTRVVGLRLLDEMRAGETPLTRAWESAAWVDRDGTSWTEVDLERLASDAEFLQVVR